MYIVYSTLLEEFLIFVRKYAQFQHLYFQNITQNVENVYASIIIDYLTASNNFNWQLN